MGEIGKRRRSADVRENSQTTHSIWRVSGHKNIEGNIYALTLEPRSQDTTISEHARRDIKGEHPQIFLVLGVIRSAE